MTINLAPVRRHAMLLWRYTLIMPTLGVAMATFIVVFLTFIWWSSLAHLAILLLGRRVGLLVGRYLGCYPFLYVMLGWFGLVAAFIWSSGGRPLIEAYSNLCDRALELAQKSDLGEIGGLW